MLLSGAFVALECLIVLFGIFMGFRRGTGCALVRLIELILIAVGSLLLGRFVAGKLLEFVMPLVMEMAGDTVSQLGSAATQLEQLVSGLLGALMVPIFFAIFFGLIKLITLVGFGRMSRRIVHGTPSRVKLEKGSKWGGAFVGLVSGVLVASILLCPIFSYIYIAGNLSAESRQLLNETFELDLETTAVVTNDRVVMFSGSRVVLLGLADLFPEGVPNLPMNVVVCRLATKAVDSETGYSATDAIPELVNMITDVVNSYNAAVESGADDLTALVQAASAIVSHMENSDFLPEATTTLLNVAGEVLQNGSDLIGISIDPEDEITNIVINSISDVLVNTSVENVSDNLKTLIGSSNEEEAPGVLQTITSIDLSKGMDLITDEESANALVDALLTLAGNENMNSLMNGIRDIALKALRESEVDLFGADAEEAYVEVAAELNDIVKILADDGGSFKDSVAQAAIVLNDIAAEYNVAGEITMPQYKLAAICIVHFFCTEENYATIAAGGTAVTAEDIKDLLGVNK